MLHLFDSFWQRSLFVGLSGALTLFAGCAPPYQSLYEGDVRFEHCYRIDEERHIPIADKLACWRGWSARYQAGQSRDRIGYAQAREQTLAQALAAGEAAAPRSVAGPMKRAIPQPTNAYAPPPQTMKPTGAHTDVAVEGEPIATTSSALRLHTTMNDGAAPDAGAVLEGASLASANADPSAPTADPPGASCAGACEKTWTSCKPLCKAGACRSGCDERYRTCMRGCF